jgi:hypothetical protein
LHANLVVAGAYKLVGVVCPSLLRRAKSYSRLGLFFKQMDHQRVCGLTLDFAPDRVESTVVLDLLVYFHGLASRWERVPLRFGFFCFFGIVIPRARSVCYCLTYESPLCVAEDTVFAKSLCLYLVR